MGYVSFREGMYTDDFMLVIFAGHFFLPYQLLQDFFQQYQINGQRIRSTWDT